jgi:hypothetical protein
MPGQDIGIHVGITEDASMMAPRIAQQLEYIGEAGIRAGEAINEAFNSEKMIDPFKKFADSVDKLYETKFGKERQLKLQYMELRNTSMEQRLASATAEDKIIQTTTGRSMTAQFGRIGGQVAAMGETGNAIPAGASILDTLGGAVSKMGVPGKVIAGAVSLAAITTIVGDQLVKTYEPFMATLMDTTAAFGGMKKTVAENSLTFSKHLNDAGNAAIKFGYTLETGTDILNQLAHGGLGEKGANAGELNVLAYARGMGATPGNLVGAETLAQRYEQGNVLGLAAGGVSFFEDSISKGVLKGFEDISGTMNFFGKLGPTWQGQLGAQRIGQMGNAVAGATSLQNETDVLLYRAAKSGAKKGGDYTDVMMEMEKGMTVGLFQNVFAQIKTMTGGNKTDTIEMLRQTFGTNYTLAGNLYEAGQNPLTEEQMAKLVSELPAPNAPSKEKDLISAEESLRLQIIKTGDDLLGAKTDIVRGMGDVVGWLRNFFGTERTAQMEANVEKYETTTPGQAVSEALIQDSLVNNLYQADQAGGAAPAPHGSNYEPAPTGGILGDMINGLKKAVEDNTTELKKPMTFTWTMPSNPTGKQ